MSQRWNVDSGREVSELVHTILLLKNVARSSDFSNNGGRITMLTTTAKTTSTSSTARHTSLLNIATQCLIRYSNRK